ncbi:MAG: GAF domain-containing protein, partial [Nostocaceae cyanobacterium]|nr:GAF domain-containing protein [Nostocaceae cyanobacterium]
LCIHQCSGPRNWEPSEIEFTSQIAEQLGVALKQEEYLDQVKQQVAQLATLKEREKAAERQKTLAKTVEKIRQSLDLDIIFKTTTQEVRQLLKVERVAIYRFYSDWRGEFVADSIVDDWTPLLKPQPIESTFLPAGRQGPYPRNETFVPILQGEKLWGLLVAYQNSQPRYWQDEEINLLAQVGVQLGIAIQQAELLEQTQRQKEELTQALKELQQTQAQLIHGEKMAGLGQLVAGVAHEINNPVNFIYGNLTHVTEYSHHLLEALNLYRQHYPDPVAKIQAQAADVDLDYIAEDLPKILDSMHVGAERIRSLVLSLRTFSRLDEAQMKSVDIHEGIESTLLILGHLLKAKGERPAIKVVKEYGKLPAVECYPAQLNQVFMNLISNSIDAIEESLLMRHLSPKEHTINKDPQISIRTQLVAEKRVKIQIADNGLGIPEALRVKVFNPFFTTKDIGKGTGLGLSISYQIVVEKHRGQIKCISQEGKGTEFWLEIPVKQSE